MCPPCNDTVSFLLVYLYLSIHSVCTCRLFWASCLVMWPLFFLTSILTDITRPLISHCFCLYVHNRQHVEDRLNAAEHDCRQITTAQWTCYLCAYTHIHRHTHTADSERSPQNMTVCRICNVYIKYLCGISDKNLFGSCILWRVEIWTYCLTLRLSFDQHVVLLLQQNTLVL